LTRFVIDASSVLAGVLGRPGSTPALVLIARSEALFEAVVCPRLVAEVRRGLAKDYFRARLDADAAEEILSVIEEVSIMLPDPPEGLCPGNCVWAGSSTGSRGGG
jgi:predicted nucleic acid-binding protein